jgi:hypothetical protein
MVTIQKVIFGEKNMYTLKPPINVVTFTTEAFIVSGIMFLYACVKEVCRLRAQPCFYTFHQLLIIVEGL